jgi:hypothetical protein
MLMKSVKTVKSVKSVKTFQPSSIQIHMFVGIFVMDEETEINDSPNEMNNIRINTSRPLKTFQKLQIMFEKTKRVKSQKTPRCAHSCNHPVITGFDL